MASVQSTDMVQEGKWWSQQSRGFTSDSSSVPGHKLFQPVACSYKNPNTDTRQTACRALGAQRGPSTLGADIYASEEGGRGTFMHESREAPIFRSGSVNISD